MSGGWKVQFQHELTKQGPFKLESGDVVETTIMTANRDFKAQFIDTDSFEAIQLQPASRFLEFWLFKPRESLEQAYQAVKDMALSGQLVDLMNSSKKQSAILKMPKFRSNFSADLLELLANAGLAFLKKPTTDYSGMLTRPEELVVSTVYQASNFEIHESGFEAASATFIELTRSSPSSQRVLSLDRPFIYMLLQPESGRILFLGQFAGPK